MLDIFRALALEAGTAILRHRACGTVARCKADASPVTEADLDADRLIRAGLAAAFPAIPVVSEECPASHAGHHERFFLVDPLDGTRDFVAGGQDFTVNIALVENGAATAGVIHAPLHDRLFLGAAGKGACAERPARGESRRIAAREADRDALVVVASTSSTGPITSAYLARYAPAEIRRVSSSLKFGLVAAGEADLYVRRGRTMEWDTAAGQAVLEAAGGRVEHFPGGAPLGYGGPDFANPYFIACGKGMTLLPFD